MKRNLFDIAILACASLALAGCDETGWVSGTAVRFGASTQAESLTRTAYGEFVEGTYPNGSTKKQMIDWQDGDLVRIACAQATTADGAPTAADYETSEGQRHGNTAESRATLSLATNLNVRGLRWGSESDAHVFYGVYPSPCLRTQYGDELTTRGLLTGTVPEDQPAGTMTTTETGKYVFAPDMTNQYLVAKRTVSAGKQSFGDDEVFLFFTPITTAIEFTVTNSTGTDRTVQSIELLSAGHNLSGTFTADLTGLGDGGDVYPTVTLASEPTKAAHVSFGDGGYTFANESAITFTIFLLPESDVNPNDDLKENVINDITFRVNMTDNTYLQTALKTDASTWITFQRCKKHFVRGIFLKEGAKWNVCYEPEVWPWNVEGHNVEPMPEVDKNSYVTSWDSEIQEDVELIRYKPMETVDLGQPVHIP